MKIINNPFFFVFFYLILATNLVMADSGVRHMQLAINPTAPTVLTNYSTTYQEEILNMGLNSFTYPNGTIEKVDKNDRVELVIIPTEYGELRIKQESFLQKNFYAVYLNDERIDARVSDTSQYAGLSWDEQPSSRSPQVLEIMRVELKREYQSLRKDIIYWLAQRAQLIRASMKISEEDNTQLINFLLDHLSQKDLTLGIVRSDLTPSYEVDSEHMVQSYGKEMIWEKIGSFFIYQDRVKTHEVTILDAEKNVFEVRKVFRLQKHQDVDLQIKIDGYKLSVENSETGEPLQVIFKQDLTLEGKPNVEIFQPKKNLAKEKAAFLVAGYLEEYFENYWDLFKQTDQRAFHLFETKNFEKLSESDGRDYTYFYRTRKAIIYQIYQETSVSLLRDDSFWNLVKAELESIYESSYHYDMAKTYLYHVMRKIYQMEGLGLVAFEDDGMDLKPTDYSSVLNSYPIGMEKGDLEKVITQLLWNVPFETPFVHLELEVASVSSRIRDLQKQKKIGEIREIDILKMPFFRGKRAYLIGRVINHQAEEFPIIFAIRHPKKMNSLTVDAVILDKEGVFTSFSVTRPSFLVDIHDSYREVFAFLDHIMPHKGASSLLPAIGLPLPAKINFIKGVKEYITNNPEVSMQEPAGTKGFVMIAFEFPGIPFIFKVSHDRVQKDYDMVLSRHHVQEIYKRVRSLDRLGRLLDSYVMAISFDKDIFPEALLNELLMYCSETVSIKGDQVIFKQLLAQRKVIPGDIYVKQIQGDEEKMKRFFLNLGWFYKDLLQNGILYGDFSLKNIGVTIMSDRVTGFDFDELGENVMSSQIYWCLQQKMSPAELLTFIGFPPRYHQYFLEHHSDLLQLSYWKDLQKKLEKGQKKAIYPYYRHHRLFHLKEYRQAMKAA